MMKFVIINGGFCKNAIGSESLAIWGACNFSQFCKQSTIELHQTMVDPPLKMVNYMGVVDTFPGIVCVPAGNTVVKMEVTPGASREKE